MSGYGWVKRKLSRKKDTCSQFADIFEMTEEQAKRVKRKIKNRRVDGKKVGSSDAKKFMRETYRFAKDTTLEVVQKKEIKRIMHNMRCTGETDEAEGNEILNQESFRQFVKKRRVAKSARKTGIVLAASSGLVGAVGYSATVASSLTGIGLVVSPGIVLGTKIASGTLASASASSYVAVRGARKAATRNARNVWNNKVRPKLSEGYDTAPPTPSSPFAPSSPFSSESSSSHFKPYSTSGQMPALV